MRKSIGILLLIITMFSIVTSSQVVAAAENLNPLENPGGYKPTSNGESEQLISKTNTIIGAVQTIGLIVAVITLTVLGIKYMVGSVSEKAEYKKTMIPYVIGVFFLVAITQILGVFSKIKIFD